MTSPFITNNKSSGKISINGISSVSGNVEVPLSSLVDILLTSLSDGQVLKYDETSSKWKNGTVSGGISSLSNLTDVSVSSPSNDQILVFTTDSSLNKWTPYSISGATFNDTNKTITISASSSLSTLTDCTFSSLVDGNLLIYSSSASKWINSNTLPDNILFIKDDLDGTKKLQFQLSGITSGQTRTLTIPDASCTVVGDTNTQTLTNKTLTDSTNNIMAKSLKSATTTVDVSSATAPSNGQVLMATSSTTATWQTPTSGSSSLSGLTDCLISNILSNQALVYVSGANKWENVSLSTSYLSDVNISSLSTNDVLLYNGTKWANNSSIYASISLLQASYFQLSLPTMMVNTNTLLISYDDSNNQSTAPIFYSTEVTGLISLTPNNNDAYCNGQSWNWYLTTNSYTLGITFLQNNGSSFSASSNPVVMNEYFNSATIVNSFYIQGRNGGEYWNMFYTKFQIWGSNYNYNDSGRFNYSTGTLL